MTSLADIAYYIFMVFKLFILFSIVPVIELAILIKLGITIGTMKTVAIVLITAAVGAFMVRAEGLGVIIRLRESLEQGIFPASELLDGALILVAGALLLTPGILTDVVGFLLVFPASRRRIKKLVSVYIMRRIKVNSRGDTIDV